VELQELVAMGVPLPVAGALYWIIQRVRGVEVRANEAKETAAKAAKDLATYKLEAAEKYASIGYLKDVEERLVRVLERIEDRLENLRKTK